MENAFPVSVPFPVSDPQTWIHKQSGTTLTVYWFTQEALLSFPRNQKNRTSYDGMVYGERFSYAASLPISFPMKGHCFFRKQKENGEAVYELCQSSPDQLTAAGYTLQPEEASPPPPALTAFGVEGPHINWGDIN